MIHVAESCYYVTGEGALRDSLPPDMRDMSKQLPQCLIA